MNEKIMHNISYWMLVFLTASVVVLGYYRYKEETKFEDAGSRFTGEDAMWLLKNSNIVLTPGAKIEGQSTPFRDFINGELQK